MTHLANGVGKPSGTQANLAGMGVCAYIVLGREGRGSREEFSRQDRLRLGPWSTAGVRRHWIGPLCPRQVLANGTHKCIVTGSALITGQTC